MTAMLYLRRARPARALATTLALALAPLACSSEVGTQHDAVPGVHRAPDTSIPWPTNPPSSGDHFGLWARWGVHTEVVPRGYWVHNLEHGGVAILFRCDGDCSAVRATLERFVRELPAEPQCAAENVARRIVLTEDPLLETPVAAAAWGWTYTASSVDVNALTAFVMAHTGHAPEDFCAEGFYPP